MGIHMSLPANKPIEPYVNSPSAIVRRWISVDDGRQVVYQYAPDDEDTNLEGVRALASSETGVSPSDSSTMHCFDAVALGAQSARSRSTNTAQGAAELLCD
jgi:hypothetical protein